MAYVYEHCDIVLSGCLSSADREEAELHVWPDADLAGDELSTRSTSGYFLEVAGGEGRTSPIAWGSKKATSNGFLNWYGRVPESRRGLVMQFGSPGGGATYAASPGAHTWVTRPCCVPRR